MSAKMLRHCFQVCLILLLIVISAQRSLAEKPQTWIELHSPNFHVITNGNEKEARHVAYQFELIRAVFRDFFRSSRSGKDDPVIIIAAKDEKTLKTLVPEYWEKRGSAHPAGLFLGGQEKNYVVLRLDVMNQPGYEPYEPVYHEYFHYLTRRSISQTPLWLVEGLAEFYGNIRIEGNRVSVGAPSTTHLMVLRQNPLLPLNALFEINASSPYYHEENKTSIFYSQSWALTHYLIIRDAHEKTHKLSDFITLFEQNVAPAEAARRTIGDPNDLEQALRQYIRNNAFYVAPTDTPKINESGFITRPISEAESLAMRADFMAHNRRYDQAEKMLEESLKLDPKLSAACESMGFLYTLQGKAAGASKWYSEALALNSESYSAHYYYALNLINGAGDDWATKAELNLRAAITTNPDFAPAYDLLAYLLALLSPNQKPDEAYMLLLHAIELDPGNIQYRIRAVHVLERLGRSDDALHVANIAVSLARTPEEQQEASAALHSAQQFQAYKNQVEDFKKAQTASVSLTQTDQAASHTTQEQSVPQTGAPRVPIQDLTPGQSDDYGLGKNERAKQAIGPAEVLSDIIGVDFGPYLQRVVHDIKQNWYPLIPDIARPPVSKKGRVAIEFAILKNGTVPAMQVVASSGDTALDRAAWASITNTRPFPPLPPEFHGDHLSLRFYYYYNPNKNDVSTRAEEISPAIQSIEAIRKKTERSKDDIAGLEHEIAALTTALDKQHLNTRDMAAAYFYRAEARELINLIHIHEGEKIDLPVAQEAVVDFDKVIASPDASDGAVNVANSEYLAGVVARNHIRSEQMAYSYWEKCAEQGHGACLNIMANARITGKGGQRVDIKEALELHTKVFNTGINYRCAGSYSAGSIAAIIYFTGVRRPGDDELEWIHKAYGLMDRLEAKSKNKNICDRSKAEIEEYLYRLSRGERRDDILRNASDRLDKDSPATKAVIDFLSGKTDESKFEAGVESTKLESTRCGAYFYAMWYMELTKKDAAARRYYDRLSNIGDYFCSTELAYSKSKFGL